MFTPTYNVVTDLLVALDLNEGFQYLPKVWSGMLTLYSLITRLAWTVQCRV